MHTRDAGITTLRLAQGPVAVLDRCRCGTLHLSVGPVTLKLSPEACASLCRTIAEGLRVAQVCELPDSVARRA